MANITCEEMRSLCIKHNWFTCGTNDQYEKLFQAIRNEHPLDEIATIVWLCSDGEWTKEKIGDELRRHVIMGR